MGEVSHSIQICSDRIQRLIDLLRQPFASERFNLGHFFGLRDIRDLSLDEFEESIEDECDTVACIAGWALFLKNEENRSVEMKTLQDEMGWTARVLHPEYLEKMACEYLGFSKEQGKMLFYAKQGSLWWKYMKLYDLDEYQLTIGDWDGITAEKAADLLERILDGQIEEFNI